VRRRSVAHAFVCLLAAFVAVSGSWGAEEEKEKPRSEGEQPTYVAPPDSARPSPVEAVPFYVPPELGSPVGRVGASTRGAGRKATLQILAPDHLGLTTAQQPTLFWFLAQPTTTRIEVTVRDEQSATPLVKVALPGPIAAGIHAFRVSDHAAMLRTDADYQWFVSLVPEPEDRSADFVVGAWIRQRAALPALRQRLAAASERQKVFLYAESGMWYDAVAAISSQIDAAPGDPALREQRAALLEQVGLSDVAAYDRQAPRAP
jgi:hypothetical protein